MTIILTHPDSDGICAAAILKSIPEHKKDRVFFSHPGGLLNDLEDRQIVSDDIILLDIAIDARAYYDIHKKLEDISETHRVIFIDHHGLPGPLPSKVHVVVDNEDLAGTTELVFRYFYDRLPKWVDRLTCIGAICDYCDNTPLIQELLHRFERRALFLDAGIVAQGLRKNNQDYDSRRKLIEILSTGIYPCEIDDLVDAAMTITKEDKVTKVKILKMYEVGEKIAWIINPPASKSKAAHWIMGDSGKLAGLTVSLFESKPKLADITIRGRQAVDLRSIVPRIAQGMGGSAGGHANALGCRIPRENLDKFIQILDRTLTALDIHLPPSIETLVKLDKK